MILGLGIDLLEVSRMRRALRRTGERLVRRVYTDQETAYCRSQVRPEQRFATRFAAKEAVMKALGTGWSSGVAWRDIEVVRDPGQAPGIRLAGRAKEIAARKGVARIHLTLTHLEDLVAAVAVLEGPGSP